MLIMILSTDLYGDDADTYMHDDDDDKCPDHSDAGDAYDGGGGCHRRTM